MYETRIFGIWIFLKVYLLLKFSSFHLFFEVIVLGNQISGICKKLNFTECLIPHILFHIWNSEIGSQEILLQLLRSNWKISYFCLKNCWVFIKLVETVKIGEVFKLWKFPKYFMRKSKIVFLFLLLLSFVCKTSFFYNHCLKTCKINTKSFNCYSR